MPKKKKKLGPIVARTVAHLQQQKAIKQRVNQQVRSRVASAVAASNIPIAPPPPMFYPGMQRPKMKRPKGRGGLLNRLAYESGLAGLAKWSGLNAENTGAALGGYLGGVPGSALGRRAGKMFRTVTGMGAYQYDPNLPPNEVPSFGGASLEDGELILCKREFIASLSESANNGGAFSIRTLRCNPGNALMFPWFSQIAANFEEWVPMGMIVMFVTLSSPINNSTTGGLGLGSVAMAADYDAYDTAPTSKQYLLQTWKVKEDRPSNPSRLEIECKPSMNTRKAYYIRTQDGVPGDLREYDLCSVFICTEGIPNATSIQILGDIYVTYKIKLRKPILTISQIPTPIQSNFSSSKFYFTAANATAALMFGNTVEFFQQGAYSAGYIDGGLVTTPTIGPIGGFAMYINSASAGSVVNSLVLKNFSGSSMVLIISYQIKGASTTLTTAPSLTSWGSNFSSFNLFANADKFTSNTGGTNTIASITVCATLASSDPSSSPNINGKMLFGSSFTVPGTLAAVTLQIIRIG